MRRLWLSLLLAITLTPAIAENAVFTFRPGKSFGPVALGASRDQMLQALSGWAYDVDRRVVGDTYFFPPDGQPRLLIGVGTDDKVKEVTLHDKAFRMTGASSIGPGCSKDDLLKQFGKPSSDALTEHGGYWDYNSKGVCFHFPSSRETPRFGKGRVESVSLYKPGASRYQK